MVLLAMDSPEREDGHLMRLSLVEAEGEEEDEMRRFLCWLIGHRRIPNYVDPVFWARCSRCGTAWWNDGLNAREFYDHP